MSLADPVYVFYYQTDIFAGGIGVTEMSRIQTPVQGRKCHKLRRCELLWKKRTETSTH